MNLRVKATSPAKAKGKVSTAALVPLDIVNVEQNYHSNYWSVSIKSFELAGFEDTRLSRNTQHVPRNKEIMEIKILQNQVDEWIKTIGVRYFNELTNMAMLTEEVGEVARIIASKIW